jgi:arylsulfatase A-like enzyme
MSFTGVAESQRRDGYKDALGTPSTGLAKTLEALDDAIARIVQELKSKRLFDSTWIVVAAPYGQSPMDARQRIVTPISALRDVVNKAAPNSMAHVSGGDVAMIWLRNSQSTEQVAKTLSDDSVKLGIQDIYYGARLALTLNTPATDSRMPDIILQPRAGVNWALQSEHALMFHGGMLDQDTHVALMISGAHLTGRADPTYVPTTQLAPLLLRALGMEKFDLRALHLEHSPALPGIF